MTVKSVCPVRGLNIASIARLPLCCLPTATAFEAIEEQASHLLIYILLKLWQLVQSVSAMNT
jgi:hypothetical protein